MASLLFREWARAALALDALSGVSQERRWREETRMYDRKLLTERTAFLGHMRVRNDVEEMMFAVRADLLRNLANMTNRCISNFILLSIRSSAVGAKGRFGA